MKSGCQYAPFADDNPYKLNSCMNVAEWKEVSRWYPFSLRELAKDGHWYDCGRFKSREQASQTMQALDARAPGALYIIVHCTLVGKEGRERVVCFHGASEQMMLFEQRQRTSLGATQISEVQA